MTLDIKEDTLSTALPAITSRTNGKSTKYRHIGLLAKKALASPDVGGNSPPLGVKYGECLWPKIPQKKHGIQTLPPTNSYKKVFC